MNVYLDFEANGGVWPQEIISIGAITEDGRRFYSLTKPHFKLDHNIKVLTGITQEMIDEAPSLESVVVDFMVWLDGVEGYTFIVYGDGDQKFIKVSQEHTQDLVTKICLQSILDNLKRVDKDVAKKFRRQTIKIESAYLTMRLTEQDDAAIQRHNALDDAYMLRYVWEKMDSYTFPEDGVTVRVDKPKMYYGKHRKNAKLNDVKFKVAVNASGIGKNKNGRLVQKTWQFPNIKAALSLVCGRAPKKIKKNPDRLSLMNQILHCAQTGETLYGIRFTFSKKKGENNANSITV